jgi:membrane-bound ClpP family serine protease
MTTATSLILIAVGAVLAFAVSYSVAGVNIQTVGIILIVVGGIGLALSIAVLVGYAPWGASRTATVSSTAVTPGGTVPPTDSTPPTKV